MPKRASSSITIGRARLVSVPAQSAPYQLRISLTRGVIVALLSSRQIAPMSSRLPPHPRRRASCQTPGSCGGRPQNERPHRFGEAFVLVAVGHRAPPPPLRRCGRSSKNVEPAVAPHSAAYPPGDEDVERPCQVNFLPSAGTVWGPSHLKSQSVRRLPIRMFFGMIASSSTRMSQPVKRNERPSSARTSAMEI